MPTPEALESFIAMVEAGRFVEAIQTFYDDQVEIYENDALQPGGLAAFVARERGVIETFKAVAAQRLQPELSGGDQVAVNWRFEFGPADDPVLTMEEVAWQTWHGDKIVRERFFYDPKQLGG